MRLCSARIGERCFSLNCFTDPGHLNWVRSHKTFSRCHLFISISLRSGWTYFDVVSASLQTCPSSLQTCQTPHPIFATSLAFYLNCLRNTAPSFPGITRTKVPAPRRTRKFHACLSNFNHTLAIVYRRLYNTCNSRTSTLTSCLEGPCGLAKRNRCHQKILRSNGSHLWSLQ